VKAALDLADAPSPGRRLFASRGASERRRPVNRAQIEAAFAAAGFEIIDPGELSYRDQARLFHEADVVVGEHGANLSNCGFCRPRTLVVEMFNPQSHDLCYVSLAEASGLLHRSILGIEEEEDAWSIDAQAALAATFDAIARRVAHLDGLRELQRAPFRTKPG
jgi:capsular polysaccharide biosynthesis protein